MRAESGCDHLARTGDGRTAADLARLHGHAQALQRLEERARPALLPAVPARKSSEDDYALQDPHSAALSLASPARYHAP